VAPSSFDLESRLVDDEPARVRVRRRRRSAGRRTCAAQYRPHPRDDLARTERLADVIVGAELESQQAIDFVHARRDHDDRNRAERSHFATDTDAVLTGQHQVEQHQRGFVLARLGDGGAAVVDAARREAVRR
jgi:hypothetical protein